MLAKKIVVGSLVLVNVFSVVSGVGAANDPEDASEVRKELRLQLRESVKQTREEFKQKLSQVKNQTKQALVEKLSEQLCDISKKKTATWMKQLDRMGVILDRVVKTSERAKSNGKDIASVVMAVEKARIGIEAAKVAVSGQAGAACGVTVSGNEAFLRSDVAAARTELAGKLKLVFDKVQTARRQTSEAVLAMAKVLGETAPRFEAN